MTDKKFFWIQEPESKREDDELLIEQANELVKFPHTGIPQSTQRDRINKFLDDLRETSIAMTDYECQRDFARTIKRPLPKNQDKPEASEIAKRKSLKCENEPSTSTIDDCNSGEGDKQDVKIFVSLI